MATDDYSGNYLRALDNTVVSSPASPILSSMISADQYMRKQSIVGSVETDCVALAISRSFLLRATRTFENQKLLSQVAFTAHQLTDGYTIRLTHRTLAGVYTLQEAMSQVGLQAPTLSDAAYGGTGTATSECIV